VIIGASRGFGKALMRSCLIHRNMNRASERTVFLLVTTNRERAMRAWSEIYKSICGHDFETTNEKDIDVVIEETDLSDLRKCSSLCEVLRTVIGQFHFVIDRFYLFLNSGSVSPAGPLVFSLGSQESSPAADEDFLATLEQHCVLNFVSLVALVRLLLNLVLQRNPRSTGLQVRVANISSLAAVREIYGLPVYGAIKSARDSIIRSISVEALRNFPEVDCRFLNYAPGLMATELVERDLLGSHCPPNDVRDSTKIFTDVDLTADRCISLLEGKGFLWKNGSHIDFYEESQSI